MKYPIGVQSFENIRREDLVYVDKTALVYSLIDNYKYVFLGRPRRFGKSLLLSTIEAYMQGRRELFEGLAIASLEKNWEKHAVLHFDFNTGDYKNNPGIAEITNVLGFQLRKYEDIYGGIDDTLSNRFMYLIQRAAEKTGHPVVILIDEYDKPILAFMDSEDEQNAVRSVLKSFFGCLKSCDANIKFAMLSGVSKFGQLSVFSDLNNIKDISLNKNYAAICGLTEDEVIKTFDTEIEIFANERGVSKDQMIYDLRKKYDGYRFSKAKVHVYNPYSLLNALDDKELKDYWFGTGTPSFLVDLLKLNDYDLSQIEGIKVDEDSLYKIDNVSVIPMLYQTGYLTIKDYYPETDIYDLGYPNQEVEGAFLKFLLPSYSKVKKIETQSELAKLTHEIKSGDIKAFMSRLKSVFYSIPYANDNSAKVQEDQFRNLTYLIFKILGIQIQVECPMCKGRSDAVVWTKDTIYVFEFKIDSTPEKALAQIRERGYAIPYYSDHRRLILIGVNYSTTNRIITGWSVDMVTKGL